MDVDPVELKRKFDAELPNIKRDIANKITADFRDTYKSIMDQFYKRDPDRYRRVPNLKYAYIGGQKHATNNSVGGIKISGSYAPHIYKQYTNKAEKAHTITTDDVLSLMWDQGIRGLPEKGEDTLPNGSVWTNPAYMTFTVSTPNTGDGAPAAVFNEYYNHYYDNELGEVCDEILMKYLDKILPGK